MTGDAAVPGRTDFGALIFDCDGVLVDSESIYVVVEMEVLAEFGLDYDYVDYVSRFVGLGVADWRRAVADDLERSGSDTSLDDVSALISERVWPRLDIELTALPGAGDLAARFSGVVAVASSSSTRGLRRKLELTNLAPIFGDHVYSGAQVVRGKPAPDLFLLAARNLNIPPPQCLVIEDSINGVRAGAAAGMTVFGFTGGGHADAGLGDRLRQAGAQAVFNNHADIERYLLMDSG